MNAPHPSPIFIGGCERSGTTLLGAMLGAHSRFVTTPESQFLDSFLGVEPDPEGWGALKSYWRFRLWGLDDEAVFSDPSGEAPTPRDRILRLVAAYAEKNGRNRDSRWVDHTPINFFRVQKLLAIFPTAQFIHIVRDGRGVAASVLPLDWGPNTVIRAASWWMERTAPGLAAETTLGSNRVIRVNYEDLVSDPDKSLKRLCAFLGVDFEDRMGQAGGFTPPVYTAAQHQHIGKPPDPARMEAWKKSLSTRQIEIFEHITGDFLPLLGYPQIRAGQSKPYTNRERFSQFAIEIFRAMINRIKYRNRRINRG